VFGEDGSRRGVYKLKEEHEEGDREKKENTHKTEEKEGRREGERVTLGI